MPTFVYTGLTATGTETSGELAASSRSEAATMLQRKNIRAVSLRTKTLSLNIDINLPVSSKDIARFTRDFATMVSSGIPLSHAVEILAEQTDSKPFAKAIGQISGDVLGGSGLAESMAKHARFFTPLYRNMVAAGEASGNLDTVLKRLAIYLEKQNSLRQKIISAMVYPAVIAIVTIASTVLMFSVVVPKFADMFMQLGGTIPAPTQIVLDISALFEHYGLWALLAIIVSLLAIWWYGKTDKGALALDGFRLKIPVLGTLLRKSSVARFSQTLSTLLGSGVSILDALSIAASTAGNKLLEKGLLLTLEKIAGGQTISAPLEETGLFPPMVIRMISVGEKTGDLSGMLEKISQSYEEEVDTAVQAMTSVLEPIMIIFMAAIIGGILVAMYLPMFEMMTTIG